MKLLKDGWTKDGTGIRVEDLSEEHPLLYPQGAILAVYLRSRETILPVGPCKGEHWRCEFYFPVTEDAIAAYEGLKNGTNECKDFIDRWNRWQDNEKELVRACIA